MFREVAPPCAMRREIGLGSILGCRRGNDWDFAALMRSTIFAEFMMFSPVSVHQELSGKAKNRQAHQGGGLQSSGGDFIQRVSSPHIVGNFRSRSTAPWLSTARLPDSSPSHS
jgi:hypothetical protein